MVDCVCKSLQWLVLILIPALGWWLGFMSHRHLGMNFNTQEVRLMEYAYFCNAGYDF